MLIACTPSVTTISSTPSRTSTPKIIVTSTTTPYLTSTAPAPLPSLSLTKPLPGLVFESSMKFSEGSQDKKLWTIDPTGKLIFLANREQEQNLLSSDQSWIIHIISAGWSFTNEQPQIWIEDRENKISRLLIPPENCTIDTNMISWSYDNKRLYYFVYCGKFESLRDVWYLDLSTWKSENLTNTPDRGEWCVIYFPDCKISFSNLPDSILTTSYVPSPPDPPGALPKWESTQRLTKISDDGKIYQILDSENGIFGYASVAPDGHAIAYDGGNILDKNGSLQTLTYDEIDDTSLPAKYIKPGIDIVNPAWSPDGMKIAWDVAHTNGNNQTKVSIFDVSNQEWTTLLTFEPYWWNLTQCTCEIWHTRVFEWSPDGQWLAFSNTESPDREITYRGDMFREEHSSVWVFNRNGEKMFSMYGVEGHPTWNPDGDWLAINTISRDFHYSITVIKVNEWKAYKVELPFESVELVDWLEPR